MPADGARLPRVLFCIGGLERGGSETQLVSIVERLHGTRVDATVVTLAPAVDRALLERLRQARVPVRVLRPRRGPRPWLVAVSVVRLGALLLRLRPAAVYAWLEEAVLLSAVLATVTRTPYLAARRNIFGRYAERNRAVVQAIYLTERRARVVTVNSSAVRDETLAHGVAPDRIRLVHNGHARDPAAAEPDDGEVVVGYVARFRTEKGHLRLLEALSRVRSDTPWRADLAGDGPLLEQIVAEADRRGLNGRVRFVGPISDPAAFWRDRHVAALLSDHEGSPNALIEAAMAGRPIVATEVGGIPDIVAPDGGSLFAPDDPDGIARALGALIEDGALRRRTGEAVRRQAVERFALDHSVDGHWAAIEETIGS